MSIERLQILAEEPSMEVALRSLLPKMLGDLPFDLITFQGKPDLLKKLPERLRGYAKWLPSTWRILILVDRDDDDCHELKRRLEQLAKEAGLVTRSADRKNWNVVNRLAIEELEAWYFGDWEAVREAYPKAGATITSKKRYRDPDRIKGGTKEAFERVMQRAGYFIGGLRQTEAAQSIARRMVPERNRAKSFQVLRETLEELIVR